MSPKQILMVLLVTALCPLSCIAQDWQSLWKSYTAGFMDNQVRVIDHSRGDCTTSEGQAYGMFFALVANDRTRFDGLLHWTEQNLAQGNLTTHLPAWMWGRNKNKQWGVLDSNSASDADIWMAYTLLEAGRAWHSSHYTKIGLAMAHEIAEDEVTRVAGLGMVVLPGARGFQHGDTYRLNASYVPLEVILGLAHFVPRGPWKKIAATIPALIKDSAPHGFVSDWTNVKAGRTAQASPTKGSYDAIRVYLWAGMLHESTPHREELLRSLSGMAAYLRHNVVPPATVRPDGSIEDPKGPVGFSAALLPYLSALQDDQSLKQQASRVQSEYVAKTGLLGNPPLYYDQNLALFGLGYEQQRFSFRANGELVLWWKRG